MVSFSQIRYRGKAVYATTLEVSSRDIKHMRGLLKCQIVPNAIEVEYDTLLEGYTAVFEFVNPRTRETERYEATIGVNSGVSKESPLPYMIKRLEKIEGKKRINISYDSQRYAWSKPDKDFIGSHYFETPDKYFVVYLVTPVRGKD